MIKNFKFHFHIFDGEGGDGGANASESAAVAGEGQEESARVEYGKAQGSERQGQNGTDKGTEGEDLQAEFTKLVGKGGKFHDLHGKMVSDAVKDRFRNQSDLQGQVNQMNDAMAPLFRKYGLQQNDIQGLTEAIANDEDLYRSGAEEQGLDVRTYMNNLKLQADAEEGRRIKENYEREQRQAQMFQRWEAESSDLQKDFPGFDLTSEIRGNENFARLINSGASVVDAFYATHRNEIFKGVADASHERATSDVVNNIRNRAARPVESGVKHSPAIVRKSDPNSFTDADMDEINRRVSDGETIYFG